MQQRPSSGNALLPVTLLVLALHCGPAKSTGTADDNPPDTSHIQVLLQQDTTADLHNDHTLLRDVKIKRKDDSREVSLGELTLWLGGVVEYDLYHFDDIYNYGSDGSGDAGQNTRRVKGTLRTRYRDWGEIKAQYDIKAGDWDDVYLRWVSRRTARPYTITVGNQKEPMGLSWLSGDSANVAQELATPVSAFSDWRSMGVHVHRAFALQGEGRDRGYWRGDDAAITTSLGVFTEDINNSNNTSLALTGRVTAGRSAGNNRTHLGIAASFRRARGNYDKIGFRPEIYEADRIVLAQPDANDLLIASLEAAQGIGALQLQAELFLSGYDGEVDGYGSGGYVQLGWFVTGQHRQYQTDWGVFARPQPSGDNWIVELFSRVSHTRGDDDNNGWNAFGSLTLGANAYYRRLRGSVNVLYGRATDPIASEDDGLGIVARGEFLF